MPNLRSIHVSVDGLSEAEKLLAGYHTRELDKRMQKALMVGARKLVRPIRNEAPRVTGALQRSITARPGKRDKPSAVVGPKGGGKRGAFYGKFVIAGTKPHRIRFPNQVADGVSKDAGNIRHPGAKPNSFVKRAAWRHMAATLRAYEEALFGDHK